MEIFTLLLLKLLPLYAIMGMGFIAARHLQVPGAAVAKVLYFLVVPVVFFHGALTAPLSWAVLALPLVPFAISTFLCLSFYRIGGVFPDSRRNLLALSAGNGNVGYFGLPVAIALFDAKGVSLYIVAMLGTTLYESTVGYYVTARGQHTVREALKKVARLPVVYGFVLGAMLNGLGAGVPAFAADFFQNMRGAYTVMGMMIIGMALAMLSRAAFDWRFIGMAFAGKFLAYPLCMLAFVALDNRLLHWYSTDVHGPLLLLSFVPMAANTVVIAEILNIEPQKIAVAVFLSTLLALASVPMMVALFL